MTLTERIFALRRVPGFDQLRDEELLAVAAGMTVRTYAPAEVVVSAGSSMWYLLVIVSGAVKVERTSEVLPPVVGADLLLTNQPVGNTLAADPAAGAVALRMTKGHFFTIVNECPAFLVEMTRLHVIGRSELAVER